MKEYRYLTRKHNRFENKTIVQLGGNYGKTNSF